MTFLLLALVGALAITLTVVVLQAGKSRRQREAELARLSTENEALGRFRVIVDASAEAERILREAADLRAKAEGEVQALLARAHAEAQRELARGQDEYRAVLAQAQEESGRLLREADLARIQIGAEAEGLRAQAKQVQKDAQIRADSIVQSANDEARAIVEQAKKRGEEIAGTAYEAVRDAERFERVAKAMKNLIEGYGDQYVIPSQSLLDDLAEEYGFAEAGQQLKNARDRTRAMVKANQAATCDYVEANRRETAIRFVEDAFNGKVDSILSRVKDDNAGTLEQQIRDAFNLVNHNGAAFRNARILDSYLAARLAELKWAAIVQELKLRDREEQRQIKERIREEERAQREFERSMRDAAKEEDALRKAMEKVRAQVDKASEEQRLKYEAQLAELSSKLHEAEERNKRALSMAQQTKMGHVYVISNVGSFGEDVFKIGLTRRLEPLDRVRELGDASVPFAFDVHTLIFSDNAPGLEHSLHKHFLAAQMNKVNPRKEFFRVSLRTIREEIEKLGITAKWTLAAEAKEYRETLAIEKTLRENPERGREWLETQARLEAAVDLADEDATARVAEAV